MTVDEMKEWIDGASYAALLHKWRFDPIGSPWFQGEVGDYFREAIKRKREVIGDARAAEVSKTIGWQR